jgi:hypothetical protein
MGVEHFCLGWDVDILHAFWQASGKAMQDLLVGSTPAPKKGKAKAAQPAGYPR